MSRTRAMGRTRWIARLVLCLPALALGVGQAQDQFSFMPAGGPGVLSNVLEECSTCDDVADLASRDLSAEEWRAYFEGEGAFADVSDTEVTTLVNYLAIAFPSEGVTDVASLPADGRTMAIMNCQLCHSIAIPMTQERDLDNWMQHRETTPHDTLSLSDVEWDTLAHYLAQNAPLPLDAIPEQLRMGAGGY